MIAAVAANGVIGRDGRLPWRLPDDVQHFRSKTLGKPVLMGRRTYASIGRPLPGRRNIVLSRDRGLEAPGCTVVHSVEEALEAAAGHPELVVMGGADLYEQLLPRAERLYLTRVEAEVPGDTRFPQLDPGEWREIERSDHPADERHPHPFSFVELRRRRALGDDKRSK